MDLVSSEDAGTVWVLKPTSQNRHSWEYESGVIFDINDTFGPCTTQPLTEYDIDDWEISAVNCGLTRWSHAEIYIPVFEAKEIQVLSFTSRSQNADVVCPTK